MNRKDTFSAFCEELKKRAKSLANQRTNDLQHYDEKIREAENRLFQIDQEWKRELSYIEEAEKGELILLEEEKKRLQMEMDLVLHKGGNRYSPPKKKRSSEKSQIEKDIDQIINDDDHDGLS